jgi:hypothetical protein
MASQLCYCRRLASTLKANHKNHRWWLRREIEPIVFYAHELDQFIVHNLHDRLPRGQAAGYFLTHRAAPDPINKRLNRRQRYIGFE